MDDAPGMRRRQVEAAALFALLAQVDYPQWQRCVSELWPHQAHGWREYFVGKTTLIFGVDLNYQRDKDYADMCAWIAHAPERVVSPLLRPLHALLRDACYARIESPQRPDPTDEGLHAPGRGGSRRHDTDHEEILTIVMGPSTIPAREIKLDAESAVVTMRGLEVLVSLVEAGVFVCDLPVVLPVDSANVDRVTHLRALQTLLHTSPMPVPSSPGVHQVAINDKLKATAQIQSHFSAIHASRSVLGISFHMTGNHEVIESRDEFMAWLAFALFHRTLAPVALDMDVHALRLDDVDVRSFESEVY